MFELKHMPFMDSAEMTDALLASYGTHAGTATPACC